METLEMPEIIQTEMSVADFIALPPHPRQRDTERHLRRASYLLTPVPAHERVEVIEAADGARFKLNGHTRALLWERQPELQPPRLLVDIYRVATHGDLLGYYSHFDNRGAVETTDDMLSGALREQGWQPVSPLFNRARFTNALYNAESYRLGRTGRTALSKGVEGGVYALLATWLPELQILDTLDAAVTASQFPGPFLAAALVTLRKYPEKGARFWHRYATEQGVSETDRRDGVQAMLEHRLRLVASSSACIGTKGYRETAGRALTCFEAYRTGRWFAKTRGVGPGLVRVTAPEAYLTSRRGASRDVDDAYDNHMTPDVDDAHDSHTLPLAAGAFDGERTS
jgi:hypothetical protein